MASHGNATPSVRLQHRVVGRKRDASPRSGVLKRERERQTNSNEFARSFSVVENAHKVCHTFVCKFFMLLMFYRVSALGRWGLRGLRLPPVRCGARTPLTTHS